MSSVVGALRERYVFPGRTARLAQFFGELLPHGASVLDVGCGDGTPAVLIKQRRPDISIEGIDLVPYPDAKIPVEKFDGRHIPRGDKSVDAVIFIDVLHHTDDPTILLREAKRVARRCVVVKDHRMAQVFAYAILRFMDWVGNAHHGIPLPYNYWPEERWRRTLAELGFHVEEWLPSLGLYPFPPSLVFDRGLHFIAKLAP